MSKQEKKYKREMREISSLKDLINTSAVLYGEKEAFLVKKEKAGPYLPVPYKKFREDIEALGTQLMKMVPPGEKIALIGENCYQWITAYFAIVNGNYVVVPLDKELTQAEIGHLLQVSGCKGAFFTAKYHRIFRRNRWRQRCVWRSMMIRRTGKKDAAGKMKTASCLFHRWF